MKKKNESSIYRIGDTFINSGCPRTRTPTNDDTMSMVLTEILGDLHEPYKLWQSACVTTTSFNYFRTSVGQWGRLTSNYTFITYSLDRCEIFSVG